MEHTGRPPGTLTRVVAELPEVWEPVAPELVRIFEEIPAAVGVPGVHQLWRRLASYPIFLSAVWPVASAALRSSVLEAGAERLRSAAFIVEAVGMPSHKAFRGDLVRAEIDSEFRAKIEHFNDLSQASLSRLLILAAMLNAEAPGGRAGRAQGTRLRASSRQPAEGAIYVPPLRAGEAVGKSRDILDRVEREHNLPLLDDYYRSLARVPEFLAAAWNAIRPLVGDPVYLARAAELTRLAQEIGTQLSTGPPVARALGELDTSDGASVRATLNIFAEQVLPQTLIDVTLTKALTSGPKRATVLAT